MAERQNILYVMRSLAHFTYHESTIKYLCRRGHNVEVLAYRRWSQGRPDEPLRALQAQTDRVRMDWAIPRGDGWRHRLFQAREMRSYASYLTRPDQDPFYTKRWERWLPKRVERAIRRRSARAILASRPVRAFLKAFERLAPADAGILEWLREHRPDVVVASPANMPLSDEVDYIKAAKALGIPTVVPVLSWDNLTTKGVFHVVPDATLAWNETQRREAIEIHGIPADRIVVTGSPFLDKWFEPERPSIDRATFCGRVGIGPQRPFVLYLGSSSNIAKDETWLVLRIAQGMRESSDPRLRDATLLARPHGANQDVYRGISAPNLKVWLRDGELPDTSQAFAEFEACIRGAVAVAGLNTTGMVDALLAGRPVIALLVDEYRNTNAYRAVHFKYLLDADVYERATTPEDCVQIVRNLMGRQDFKQDSRAQFVLDYIRPHGADRAAGEIAAQAIEMVGLSKSVEHICKQIAAGQGAPVEQTHDTC